MTESATAPRETKVRRILGVLCVAGFAVGALAYPLAWTLDRTSGRDVIALKSSPDAAQIEVAQATFDDSLAGSERLEAVVNVYGGTPRRPPAAERYLFLPDDQVFHPQEDATLTLLRAPPPGAYYYQSKSLLLVALCASVAGLAGGVVLLAVRRLVR